MIKQNEIEIEVLFNRFTIHHSNLTFEQIDGINDSIYEIDNYETVQDLECEYWLDVLGYDGYMVSNLGRVKSLYQTHEKLLEKQINIYGYETVRLSINGRAKNVSVHRLVADNFLINKDNKPTVDHINRKRNDNRLENLRWATYEEQGENKSEYTKQIKIVGIDIKTSKVVLTLDSYSDGKRFNLDPQAISANVNGHTESYKGLVFVSA